jgi:hypothetical protein
LGSSNNPNSALFNLSQIASLMINGKPQFGVYDQPYTFTISLNTSTNNFQINSGVVFYQAQSINIPSQSIPYKSTLDRPGLKLFKFYFDYNDFVISRQIFTATIISVNYYQIILNQLPSQFYLNNFKQININGYIINVLKIDSSTKTITLNQDVQTNNIASAGNTVNLIFQPVLKFIVSYASVGTPPNLDIPNTGIDLANVTLNIDSNYNYTQYGIINYTYVPYPNYQNPSQLFPSQNSYNTFLNLVNNSIQSYKETQNYNFEVNLLKGFSDYTKSLTTLKFDTYWHTRPFVPTQNFEYGINYSNLQQTYFDSRFKDLWYNTFNQQLTKTLAIFRGDIYAGTQNLQNLGVAVTVSNFLDFTNTSTLYNGSYTYAVSGVSTNGETSLVYNTSNNYFFNSKINNFISFTTSNNYSPLYYHIYKNLVTNGITLQQRLTSPFQVLYKPFFDNISPSYSASQNVNTKYTAYLIKSGISSGVIGGVQLYGNFTNTPNAILGIQSVIVISAGQNYTNPTVIISGNGIGATISLTTSPLNGSITNATIITMGSSYSQIPTLTVVDSALSNGYGAVLQPIMSSLSIGLYTGSSSQPLGTSIASFANLPIYQISTAPAQYSFPLINNSFISLNSSVNYWAVIQMNMPYGIATLNVLNSSNYGGGTFCTSANGTTWISGITTSQIGKLGFLDQGTTGTNYFSKGVYFTNEQPPIPTKMQIFIPNMDLSSLSNGFDSVGITSTISKPIQNSMIVNVTAFNSITGYQTTLSTIIPQYTARGSSIQLGGSSDLYDTILDVNVQPNVPNVITQNGVIQWSIYDLFTVDTLP